MITILDAFVNKSSILDNQFAYSNGWNRVNLFATVITIIGNCQSPLFNQKLASNERYYSDELIDTSLQMVQSLDVMTSVKNKYAAFCDAVKEEHKQILDMEFNYDDAPQEFIDPVTYELITDPIRLPDGAIVDKSTYEYIMRDNRKHPLTQVELDPDECHLDEELKKRIDEYRKQKLIEKRKQQQAEKQ